MKGNIIFYKKNNSFISRVIANITKCEFTHVALIVGYDEINSVATVIESNRFISTRITTTIIDGSHVVYTPRNTTEEMTNRVVEYAYKQLGTKYDYLQIFGLFISLISKGDKYAFFNSSNKLICSELIDLAYFKSGIHRKNYLDIGNITPKELLEVYELEETR